MRTRIGVPGANALDLASFLINLSSKEEETEVTVATKEMRRHSGIPEDTRKETEGMKKTQTPWSGTHWEQNGKKKRWKE
jgi:hypothetical protein